MKFLLFLIKILIIITLITTLFVVLLALIISKEKLDNKTPSEVAIYKQNGTFEILQFGGICYQYMSNFAEALSYFVKSLLKLSREVIESAKDVKICLEDFFGFFLVDFYRFITTCLEFVIRMIIHFMAKLVYFIKEQVRSKVTKLHFKIF
ncbi:hypothetical protein F8M41_007517 [Gigaspora margarita]|uniref:Uncharacterized protein n=1 Tax=Gigaspora margarita TaxID=4874 RepID=A0A8H4AW46_GIGMA|nr:hypothetical protein F8M41_007517 [Gigaspora margarita]